MNLNPTSKKILCYGDSNTWGVIPGTKDRFPVDKRWTGLLQTKLGDSFEVIEEGLNGRTTNIDDEGKKGRNGLTYLRPCLETNNPFDFMTLMLGTNDLKERYNQTPEQITGNTESLIKEILLFRSERSDKEFKILLISPPIIDESVEGVEEKYKQAQHKSEQIGSLYRELALKYDLFFLDAAKIVKPSKVDGYHLDANSHQKLAEAVYFEIRENI